MSKHRWIKQYEEILREYIQGGMEDQLYRAQKLSKGMLEHNISPEELVNYHVKAMENINGTLPKPVKDSFHFLIEMMMNYGIAYREHRSLRFKQQELESELNVAANMQKTLLPEEAPDMKGLDIGVISVPAKAMSGDYFNFVHHDQNVLGVAIADIIGKGVPAALCMSMIKYAMDSMYDKYVTSSEVLYDLNKVVEKNVDPSMFITMFYGIYDLSTHTFEYAAAGHEPGLLYKAEEDRFYDLETRGLVLGVSAETEYREDLVKIKEGDMIVLFTDGVTETRINHQFLSRTQLTAIVRKHMHLSMREMTEAIHRDLLQVANFELKDDQTIIGIKRDA